MSVAGGRQLAAVLAQLRRDVGIAEVRVHGLLVLGAEDLAGLGGRDPVLGDREAPSNRVLAKSDVVLLRAGEVLEQVAVRLGWDDAEVEAEPVVRDHRRLRVALRDDVRDPVELREVVDQRRRVGRGSDDVEVAERLTAAANRAGLGDLHGCWMLAENRDDGEHGRQSLPEEPARLARVFRRLGERLQDLRLGRRAEAGKGAHSLALGRGLQLVQGRHPELLPDPARRLRAEPRQPHELDDLLGDQRLPLGQRLHLAELDHLDDLALDRGADPAQALRFAVERELRNRPAGLANPRRRAAVGEHPERALSLELAQIGQQLELIRQLVVPRQGGH